MRYISWLLRAALFILLLGLAVKNNQPVTLRYFFNYEWQSTQAIVLLVFFAAGTLVGVLAMLVSLMKQRREIARLKREIRLVNDSGGVSKDQAPLQPY